MTLLPHPRQAAPQGKVVAISPDIEAQAPVSNPPFITEEMLRQLEGRQVVALQNVHFENPHLLKFGELYAVAERYRSHGAQPPWALNQKMQAMLVMGVCATARTFLASYPYSPEELAANWANYEKCSAYMAMAMRKVREGTHADLRSALMSIDYTQMPDAER